MNDWGRSYAPTMRIKSECKECGGSRPCEGRKCLLPITEREP